MYAPEIYGRSDVQTIKVGRESEIIRGKAIKKRLSKYMADYQKALIMVLLLVLIGAVTTVLVIILRRRGIYFAVLRDKIRKMFRKDNISPPTPSFE